MIPRKVKNRGKRLLRDLFELSQQMGFDILPRHFYSEIPNVRELRKTAEWRKPLSMSAVVGSIDSQILFVDQSTAPFREKLKELNLLASAVAMNETDEGFGAIEADFLYCFIRKYQPRSIVQVGCGVSTAVCLMASRHQGYKPHIVCIEPYPTMFLKKAADSGDIQLIQKKLQDVYGRCAGWVSKDDLFFIDSSHTLGPAGEVSRIILDILPNLCSGAFVHFHDIWLPYDYDPGILDGTLFFWHETALLCAFLCMNQRFRIEASLSMLHHQAREELQKCLPTYCPAQFVDGINCGKGGHYPSSIYLRT